MKTKYLFPVALAAMLSVSACSASVETLNNQGNDAFTNQDYEAALAAYQQAKETLPQAAQPHYNTANTLYRTGNFEQVQQEMEQALANDDGTLTQNSTYNLGNSYFQTQQFEPAIEAYKEALRLDPDDTQAKHNLELALQQRQQQQEQKNDSQDQNQQQQQDNQQQNGDPSQQDQQQQNDPQDSQNQQQQQDNQQQGSDQSQQNRNGGSQPKDGNPNDPSQNGRPQIAEGLTKEQARQLFEAATQGTESLEQHLQQVLVVPGGTPAEDW